MGGKERGKGYLVDKPKVDVHQLIVEVVKVPKPVAVANVVDANEECEEGVVGFPWGSGGVRAEVREEKVFDLVCEGEDVVAPGLDEG